MAGIYIHIPFCRSRCIYCGFYSTTGCENMMDRYVDCLVKELHLRRDYINKERISTIYMGGGTPSLLPQSLLMKLKNGIFGAVPTTDLRIEEFTVECNPDDVDDLYSKSLKEIGVNRVSMGVQTFSDNRLSFLRRRHSSKDIVQAVRNLRQAGIKNISIDLMFGFPEETVEEWEEDIDMAIELNVEHISAYSLMYEEGTPLYVMLEQGKISITSDDTSREMFELLIDKLESAGYEHYEISNFAKHRYQSKHNSSYWHDVPYIGLGSGAHSYNGSERQWNVSDIFRYMQSIEDGKIPCTREFIDEITHYNDMVTTAMRTSEGINLGDLDEKYHEYILSSAQKAIKYGNMVIEHNHLRLTRKGIFISDDIMSDLIYER